jgi:trehalose 6-phosphate synthase
VLWPLFHYQPGFVKYYDEDWRAYVEVNRRFAKEIAPKLSDGDLIWVHDYHLMLLPAMLREETLQSGKTIRIGFFLHTPFPCADMFSILPVSHEILEGLLQSDLVGFHTRAYAKNFVSTCSTIL